MIKKIALVLLAVGVSICCCACRSMPNINEPTVEPALFSTVEGYANGYIIVDNQTGVMYWLSTGTYNGGTLTLLVDEAGNPKILKRR